MKKYAVIVSILLLAVLTVVSAEEVRMTPEADCLAWWRLGSPFTAYDCLASLNASCPGTDIPDGPSL